MADIYIEQRLPSLTYTAFLDQCAVIKQDQATCVALTSMLSSSARPTSLDHIIGAHVLTVFVFSAGVPDFATMSRVAMQHANLIGILFDSSEDLKQRIIFRAAQPNQAVSLELASYNAEAPNTNFVAEFEALRSSYEHSCDEIIPFAEQLTPVMQQTAESLSNVTVENVGQREIQEQIRQTISNLPTVLAQPGAIADYAENMTDAHYQYDGSGIDGSGIDGSSIDDEGSGKSRDL